MASCQICGTEILGSARFCRKCGAPVATSVQDFVDTRRFNPDAPFPPTANPATGSGPSPAYVPPQGAYPAAPGSDSLYRTGAVKKPLGRRKAFWLIISLMIFLIMAGTISTYLGRRVIDRANRRAAERVEWNNRRSFTESVKNALGVELGNISDAGYSNIQGVFIDSLTGDDSPAAVAGIQAGDVLMEINGQPVRNSSELAQVMNGLRPGAEVDVKIYRDGEMLTTRLKVADPFFSPPQIEVSPREQGFLGVRDIGSRRRVPGTNKWGVEIGRPVDNGPADLAGLQSGDIVTEFDGHAIRTRNEFGRRIRATKPRTKVTVKFYRGSAEMTTELIVGHRD